MFKKNKLASGVVLAIVASVGSVPAALAANVAASTETTHSAEGAGAVTTYGTAVATLTLGQSLVVNDEVHVTMDQALATAAKFPASLTCVTDATAATGTGIADTCTMTRFSNTTTVGKYRLTALTASSTANGVNSLNAVVTMPVATLTVHNSLPTNVTFHTQSSSGGSIDTDATTVVATFNTDELSVARTRAWNGVIDVDNSLKKFVNGADSDTATTDTAIYTVTLDAGATLDAEIQTYTVVVKGDFTFLDAGAATGVDINAATHGKLDWDTGGAGSCSTYAAGLFNTAMDTYTTTCTPTANQGDNVAGTDTLEGIWTMGSAPNAMSARAYTVDLSINYHTEANVLTTEANLVSDAGGAWTENTANVTAYSVPMSSSVTRMLWLSNTGSTSAAVTATVEAGGVTYGPYTLGTVASKSNSAMGQTLDTKLAADATWTAAAYTSRANVTFAAATSSANVELSAGYYSTGDKDRQTLETSQKQ